MSEAKVVQETNDFIDVELTCDLAEMEADRGMSIKEWTDRYIEAAQAVIPECYRELVKAKLTEAAEADFFMLEGSPEHNGSKEGRLLVDANALRDIVFRELDTATDENRYPLESWTAEAIADDLARYSPALDDRDPADLVPAVQEWLQQRREAR